MMSILAHHFLHLWNNHSPPKDRERYDIMRKCLDTTITNKEAAVQLHLTVRQVQKLKRKVAEDGEQGVVHGNRGRVSNRALAAKKKKEVISFLHTKKHQDFGPTYATEQLEKQKDITLSVKTMSSFMVQEKLWKPRGRRGADIRHEWRERRPMYGELIQFDGSYHDWFEDSTEACLLAAIDDATGKLQLVFEDNEGVHAVFRFWLAYIEAYGLPRAIYLNKFSTYKINHKNAVDNAELMTQFERAMEALNIEVICANSPQAKGRVERLFRTLQDRLVKDMRLEGTKDRKSANVFLKDIYTPDHHTRFSVEARHRGDAHRPLTPQLRAQLSSIFSIHMERVVKNDYTVQFKNKWLQLKPTKGVTVYKKDLVTIEEWLDGVLHVRLKQTYLAFEVLPHRPVPTKKKVTALIKKKTVYKPAPTHPWRKYVAPLTNHKP